MLRSLYDKLFGRKPINKKSIEIPNTFKKKSKKNVFLNRYAGAVYFLIFWHAAGYLLFSGADTAAKAEGYRYLKITICNI
jgi:hypothetical protein